jgi:hypothetical protein
MEKTINKMDFRTNPRAGCLFGGGSLWMGMLTAPFGIGLTKVGIFPFKCHEIPILENSSDESFLYEHGFKVNKDLKYIKIFMNLKKS